MVTIKGTSGPRLLPILAGLYGALFLLQRLALSPTLHRDEAEQFLFAAEYTLTTGWQPPLYSWLVRTLALPLGLNLFTIVLVKYLLIFLFYLSFYSLCRCVWEWRQSAIVTGSLMLFNVYAYEFNRDLSHSVLVSVIASATLLVAIRLLESQRTSQYVLLGILAGLGMLSKYNYIFIVSAIFLAALTTADGRRMLWDRRILISVLLAVLIVLPHFVVVFQNHFFTVSRALHKSRAYLASLAGTLQELGSAYAAVALFGIVFLLFFGGARLPPSGVASMPGKFFRRTALWALALPLLAAFLLQAGEFKGRWLAPVLFTLPLALFTTVDVRRTPRRTSLFAGLCLGICVIVFAVRGIGIWLPRAVGPAELQVPFAPLSAKLQSTLERKGIRDLSQLPVISDSNFLRANLMIYLPFRRYHMVQPAWQRNEDLLSLVQNVGAVFVWDVQKEGERLPAPVRAVFPQAIPLEMISVNYQRREGEAAYRLGVALVSRGNSQIVGAARAPAARR